MNLSITGKQFELTDSIKNYVESAFENLNKYGLDIISGRCVISADERNGKKGFIVDFLINLAKKDTIVIRHKDKDLYAAIDSITNRASKILRRTHDKKQNALDEILKNNDTVESVEVDEIIPTELELYKPLEIDEALEKLKSSSDQFLVFNDIDAKMRVIYKRKDGKFGLF